MSEEGENVEATLRGMCYEGERVGDVVRVGEIGVAITSHRVLVLDPDGEPRFRALDLPNVIEANPDTDGDTRVALQAAKRGAYAVGLFAVSVLVNFEAFASDLLGVADTPSGQGVGQVVAIVRGIVNLLGAVDDLLGLAGLFFALVALLHAVQYARSRTRVLEFEVSGRDSIRVPIGRDDVAAARRVGEAVERASDLLGES